MSGKPKATKNRRRRGRELALQALFSLDHQNPGLGATLYRIKERALTAELECLAADGAKDEARGAAQALLQLDPKHPLALEAMAWLDGKGPIPVPPSKDERVELEAVRGGSDEIAFCEQLVKGVSEHKDAIDKLLQTSSTNWKVGRMAVVDRNILRIGVYELQHLRDIPPRVTLNEAIEIGKRYGTTDSGAFINGILDKVATRLGHPRGVKGDDGAGASAPRDVE